MEKRTAKARNRKRSRKKQIVGKVASEMGHGGNRQMEAKTDQGHKNVDG